MNSVVIAVAGAGKTQLVANRISLEKFPERTWLLTYLTRNQIEDSARIAEKISFVSNFPRVMGWFGFLLNEIIRPYSKLCFPEIEVGTLCTQIPEDFRYRSGAARYFTKSGDVFSERLSQLAVKVIEASEGKAIRRLERVVDAIYIDEAQDLRGNDLVVIEKLMTSSINVTVVCDPRQAVVETARSDTKYKKYRYEGIANYFVSLEKKGVCKIEYKNETHRFTQEIARLADAVISSIGDFPQTISKVEPQGYSGLYFIAKKQLETYAKGHHATVLRLSKKYTEVPGVENANFGECKGMTRRDIAIIATGPIEDLFIKGKPLKAESARKLYVAITRAQQSVAIAVSNPEEVLRRTSEQTSCWNTFHFRMG